MQKPYIQTFLANKATHYTGSVLLLVFSVFLGTSLGSVSISFEAIARIISGQLLPFLHMSEGTDPTLQAIILQIRLPRVVLAGLVGGALAISGAAFQGLLKNPLADPYTLGVSSGASVGAVAVLFLGITLPFAGSFTLPVVSIAAAICTIFIVVGFARLVDRSMSMTTIILTGIIFSSFLGSFISLMISLTGEELRQIINWLLGSVGNRGWDYVHLMLPFFVIGVLLLMFTGQELNAMTFGEERAKQLGVHVERQKYMILSAASILTGAAVAVSGTIGFVGLVIPHICRKIFGSDHRHLIPLCVLNGSAFLILADLLARTIVSPSELPIGVVTALIGAPMFAVILIRRRKGGRSS
ncbi:iron chelate uptake ABC transporter family permease subunit [Halobacillus litoralis]|uniref:Iron chelate uptake ABC transporter family permease subunit n=1 Tax=Halobacillus litoralis TaxID=45668 RepID=A0A845DZW0_9BACI|nr:MULTISPECIES: iron ABC transporter permease [Halobacillus]MCA1022820.1 iron ABC transporter permease [Halobacillus litoralis]MYL19567.1 iron chelate uptake ABC transporter family permease subunit [Halobacillus litoralis]MYL28712.1 iron chelate uptake ABC transporter family permease subunit [Halobacillus halophilus]MYL36960.1 iron chelate uptake ABC transporter family permease subunit [Halobacillus litoralis]